MAWFSSAAPRREEEETSRGGAIAALVIAIPISLALWAVLMFVLFNLVR